jgi:hypothetical protein
MPVTLLSQIVRFADNQHPRTSPLVYGILLKCEEKNLRFPDLCSVLAQIASALVRKRAALSGAGTRNVAARPQACATCSRKRRPVSLCGNIAGSIAAVSPARRHDVGCLHAPAANIRPPFFSPPGLPFFSEQILQHRDI